MNELAGRLAGTLVGDATLERAFEAGLPEWSTLAFRVAFSVLRHREDAEDIAQEALTKAHRNLGQLRDRERLRAWLVRMTWRMALDRKESDGRRVAREDAAPAGTRPITSEELLLEIERRRQLWTAIDALSDKLRIVVIMASIEEQDLAAVAATLEIPEGTVKSRLFEAKRQLRERLQ